MVFQTHDKLMILGDKMPQIVNVLEQEVKKYIEDAKMETEVSIKFAREALENEIEDLKIRVDVDAKKIMALGRNS
jgi:20S proteasome alpha/beta subunit